MAQESEQWLSSEAAAIRLGVKPATLYAYVSRGIVRSERLPGTRRSRFSRRDVERLAGKRRGGGGRAGGLEVVIETDLTLLDPAGRLYYRGWDVAEAVAGGASFEEVTTWLWEGERAATPIDAPATMTDATRPLAHALAAMPPMDRLRALVVGARQADPLRDDRRTEAVAITGRSLIAVLVDALPPLVDASPVPSAGSVAQRLWPRLSPLPADPSRVALLDAALVLLADHELAASTLAARVAASTWADPYLVVSAGLATLGGPLHGGASRGARQLIREVDGGATAAEAIGSRLREQQLIAGFGHRIYDAVDPRAEVLLGLLGSIVGAMPSEQALLATMRDRNLPFPNVDFALASMAERHQMIDDAGELIFTVARIAGWLAHAAEEYQHRLRYRSRAVYTGPPPTQLR
jgi:citrate synthase